LPRPICSPCPVSLFSTGTFQAGHATITVFNDSCSIFDLKTGEPSDSHIEQLRVYSVLWDGDRELNPDRLPLRELKILYGSSAISLDLPTRETLGKWRSAIAERTESVVEQLAASPTPARPSAENCSGCQVKLLCNEYWKLRSQSLEDPFQDLEINLMSKQSDVGWVAQDTRNGVSSRELLFIRPNGSVPYWDELTPGMRIRLTDAHYTDREGEIPLVVATTFSEAVLI
jgi:PD-(D/E)XK nuclease superfamily